MRPGAHTALLRVPHLDDPGATFLIPCLVLMFKGPSSYTGQDSAEIQVAGQQGLVQRLLALVLSRPGVRMAQPGEFTARAFLSGRLSVDQAEGVQALIGARSVAEANAARRMLSGETGALYRALADDLAAALALVEAGIDFTDQDDVVAITPRDLVHRLRNMIFGIECLVGPSATAERWSHEPRIVLAGAPNAGKSTLFNALLGHERVVVNAAPGTTRDAVQERLDLRDAGRRWGIDAVLLADIAGLDRALADRAALDRAGQSAAHRAIADADVIIWCDPTGRFDPGEFDLPDFDPTGRRVLRVRTKADLLRTPDDHRHEEQHEDAGHAIGVCAIDGWGIAALRRAIADAACDAARAGHGAAGEMIVLPRHRRCLASALESLAAALAKVEPDRREPSMHEPELVAGLMRAALDAVGEIVGAVSPDDVIGRIFATFCVGK
jgi:tRNA modification GTPase